MPRNETIEKINFQDSPLYFHFCWDMIYNHSLQTSTKFVHRCVRVKQRQSHWCVFQKIVLCCEHFKFFVVSLFCPFFCPFTCLHFFSSMFKDIFLQRPYQILSLSRKDKLLNIWFIIRCSLVVGIPCDFFSLREMPSLNYNLSFHISCRVTKSYRAFEYVLNKKSKYFFAHCVEMPSNMVKTSTCL